MYPKTRFEVSYGIFSPPLVMATVSAALLFTQVTVYGQLLAMMALYSAVVRTIRFSNLRFFTVDMFLCLQERLVFKRQTQINLSQVLEEPKVKFSQLGYIFDYGTIIVKAKGGKSIKVKYVKAPQEAAAEIDRRRKSYQLDSTVQEKIIN